MDILTGTECRQHGFILRHVRDDAQFDLPGGIAICGPWITLSLSGESAPYTLEAARFTGTHQAVPVWCFDGLKAWVASKPAALRQAYTDALIERDESRADDRAEWAQQFLPAAE